MFLERARGQGSDRRIILHHQNIRRCHRFTWESGSIAWPGPARPRHVAKMQRRLALRRGESGPQNARPCGSALLLPCLAVQARGRLAPVSRATKKGRSEERRVGKECGKTV